MKINYYSGRLLSKWFRLKNRWVATYRKLQAHSKIETLKKLNKLSLTLGIKKKIAIASMATMATLGVQAQLSFEKVEFSEAQPLKNLNLQTSKPTFTDIDSDGDEDLVVGSRDGNIHLYLNQNNAFTEIIGPDNPVDRIKVSGFAAPAFVDLDNDGDLDLAIGDFTGITYYNNNNGVYTLQTGTNSPFGSISVYRGASPAFVDFDGDGDQDLVFVDYGGGVAYYSNKIVSGKVTLTKESGPSNPFNGVNTGYSSFANLVDVDNDGDTDLVAGQDNGKVRYFLNDINNGHSFLEQTGANNLFASVNVGGQANTTFIDFDGDNDLDLIVGSDAGNLWYYENDAGTYTENNSANFLFSPDIEVKEYSSPVFVDFDGDNDLDLISGDKYGTIKYFEKVGGLFVEKQGTNNPFDGIDVGSKSVPQLVDVNNDGKLDIVSGADDGKFYYYEDNGTGTFVQKTGANNPFDGFTIGRNSAPTFIDLDGDNDLEIIVGSSNTSLSYIENNNGVYTEKTGVDNPFDGITTYSLSDVAVADIDNDGDLDVIVGSNSGRIQYLTKDNNTYTEQTTTNPFEDMATSQGLHKVSPTFVDLNGDGKLDVVFGNHKGSFIEYRNTTQPLITSLNKTEKQEKTRIYPNPVAHQLFVEKTGAYQISDITGTVMLKGEVSSAGIDVSSLNNGYYIINVAGTVTSFIKK